MWVIFQLFAWTVARAARPIAIRPEATYWLQVVALWVLIALQFPVLAMLVPDVAVTDPAGAEWQSGDLFQSMAVVSIFTMLFTAILAIVLLHRARQRDV
jgi:hypothetical protein